MISAIWRKKLWNVSFQDFCLQRTCTNRSVQSVKGNKEEPRAVANQALVSSPESDLMGINSKFHERSLCDIIKMILNHFQPVAGHQD